MRDTTQFLRYRFEAMAKRIAELETENASLKDQIKYSGLSERSVRELKNKNNS